ACCCEAGGRRIRWAMDARGLVRDLARERGRTEAALRAGTDGVNRRDGREGRLGHLGEDVASGDSYLGPLLSTCRPSRPICRRSPGDRIAVPRIVQVRLSLLKTSSHRGTAG